MERHPPNILLLALESTPASHLSGYGYPRLTTPNLDRLAEESVLYEQAISAAAWTLPSHASLFTGLHVSQHGTQFSNPFLRPDLLTLAEMLRNQGYDTAAFTTNDWVNEKFGFSRGFNTFRWSKRTLEWLKPLFPAETKLEKVIRYLRDPVYPIGHRNNKLLQEWIRGAKRPFFAYTLYFDPHYPYRPHYPYARRFLRGQRRPWWRVNMDPDRYMAGAVKMDESDFAVLNALYDSRLASTDAIIGRFVDWLRDEDLLDDTLLIVVADHGENLGEHGLMSHQYSVYDTLVHVPLIIRYPALFPPGQRISQQVQTLELFTTIMDVAGVDPATVPNDVRGRSLVPRKLAATPQPVAISEYLSPNLARMRRLFSRYDVSRYDRSLRSIRREDCKAIFASDGQVELYDLRHDPAEMNNLAAERPELVAEMQAELDAWLQAIDVDPAMAGDAVNLDPVIVRRLEALGYF